MGLLSYNIFLNYINIIFTRYKPMPKVIKAAKFVVKVFADSSNWVMLQG